MGQLSSVVTTQITMKVAAVLSLVFISAISAKRDPKLFFVSTSSTTSTVSTVTTCFTTTAAATACTGRKKRSISIIDELANKDDAKIVDPSPLESSIAEQEGEPKSQRQGKFLLYWLTTTTTSTSTSFTSTAIVTLVCTASPNPLTICP